MTAPTVVLVGRPNVGKSTLFNRLSQSRRALTSPIPGTTRDWLEGTAYDGERSYRIIDTGGYAPGEEDVLVSVRAQVERWVRSADLVVWVTDGAEGLTAADQSISQWIRRLAKKILVAVNKVDDAKRESAAAEFYRLGFPHVVPLSATHGRNIHGLMEKMEELVPAREKPPEAAAAEARVAVVGRPNVGKSSLMNRIMGEERMIVSDVPGTTRDMVDTRIEWEGRKYLFIDTAGLRAKKSKGAEGLEGLTRLMSEKALDRAEVAVLVLDAGEGILEGDTAVGRLIQEKSRACVVAVNKWDVVGEKPRSAGWYRERHPRDMPFMAYCPLVFISAKTGHNIPELMGEIGKAHEQFHRRFETEELEAFFWSQIQERPYSHRGRKLIFKTAEQVASSPPTLVIRSNLAEADVHFSYQRHLESVFRQKFGLSAVPLHLRFRRK